MRSRNEAETCNNLDFLVEKTRKPNFVEGAFGIGDNYSTLNTAVRNKFRASTIAHNCDVNIDKNEGSLRQDTTTNRELGPSA